MRCLGIPNSKHFTDITKINDAILLWEKIKGDSVKKQWKPEYDEEYEEEEVQNQDKSKRQNFDLAGLQQGGTRTASNYETQAPPDPSQSRTPSINPDLLVSQSNTQAPFVSSSNTPRPSPPPASASNTPGIPSTSSSNTPGIPSRSAPPSIVVTNSGSLTFVPSASRSRPPPASASRSGVAPTRTPSGSRSRVVRSQSRSKRLVVSDCSVVNNRVCNKAVNCRWDVYLRTCVAK
jgi:hypothetical protein